jgi:IS30 family transposase
MGGIAPSKRSRSARVLSNAEREEISRGLSGGQPFSLIAGTIGRSISTVSREVYRNGGKDVYRANQADQRAWFQSKRPKKCWLALNETLRLAGAEKLRIDWSPEQVVGFLKHQFPDKNLCMCLMKRFTAVFFIQARGVLKKT